MTNTLTPPRPEIITQVPSQSQLEAMYGPSSMSHTIRQAEKPVPEVTEFDVLNRLRDQLAYGEPSYDYVSSVYETARYIGDRELIKADRTDGVDKLFNASNWYATPQQYGDLGERRNDAVGTYDEFARSMEIHMDFLDNAAKGLKQAMIKEGMPLLNERDAYLAGYLHIGAHESGHALLAGVSELAVPRSQSQEKRMIASRLFLGQHPDMAFTGDWETDVRIQEERFAQGYAEVVMKQAFATLGYSPQQTAMIIEYMAPVVGAEKVKTAQHSLGYHAPLSDKELISELHDLSTLIQKGDYKTGVIDQDTADWTAAVQAHQSRGTKKALKMAHSVAKAEQIRQDQHREIDLYAQAPGKMRRLGSRMIRGVFGRVTRP